MGKKAPVERIKMPLQVGACRASALHREEVVAMSDLILLVLALAILVLAAR